MKKYLFIAASALALASCSNDAYLGDNIENTKPGESGQILFASSTGKLQKDPYTGATAAAKLGNKFIVLGTKGTLPATSTTTDKVFDNYLVEWGANTAGTTASNTDDWEYVGKTPVSGISGATSQTIKYWDYSASQYDFIAYSVGANTLVTAATSTPNQVQGTAIVSPTTAAPTSFTLTAPTVEDLAECYYTDVTTVPNASFGQPVTLEFKNLTAKVRVAFYETIPGYTVSDLEFYEDASAPVAAVYTVVPAGTDLTDGDTYYTSSEGDGEFVSDGSETDVAADTYWTLTTPASPVPTNEATLFVTGSNKLAANGAITVTYPVVGQDAASTPGYNKAFVSTTPAVTPTSTKTSQTFGTVNYTGSSVLATTASAASMAGVSGDLYYTPVLPAAGQPLTLRVNYTLTSEDGNSNKETIKVWGATAVVPASYTAWQPNYAYTYIFKISDNSNGSTAGLDDSRVGLHPITFDAVVAAVADASDFNHESITTVSTPSVTSYAFNNTTNRVIKAYGAANNEYPKEATTDIYFSVFGDAQKADLNTKGQLYSLSAAATEAEVIDALQIIAASDANTITGRNGLTLTKVATATSQTAVPTDDGKTVTVSANSTAKVTASGTATYYAYVYDATPSPAPAATPVYTAVELTSEPADWATEGVWYNDHVGTSAMKDETFSAGTYYKKYSNTNRVYGVKVVHTY